MEKELARYPSIDAIKSAMESSGWRSIEVTHTHREYPVTVEMLEQVRNKAFSSLQLISDEQFARGMAELEHDFSRRTLVRQENYSLVWGAKPDGPAAS